MSFNNLALLLGRNVGRALPSGTSRALAFQVPFQVPFGTTRRSYAFAILPPPVLPRVPDAHPTIRVFEKADGFVNTGAINMNIAIVAGS